MKRQKDYAEVNGTRLYFEVAGSGHPMILIHGFTLDNRMWDDQFDTFALHYQVIRFDVRGFGKSALPTCESYSYAADLKALIDHLGISHAYVLGLSLGGMIAIDFALEHPEATDALILADTALGGFQWQKFGKDNPFPGLDPPAIERLDRISAPTLIIVGELDLVDFHSIAGILKEQIPAARKVVLPDVGHVSNMEDPGKFNEIVLGFLADL
jgi:pimeloyl-ACP methyl ester carboxylesterase